MAITSVVNENDFATLTGTISHPALNESLKLEIKWGDGTTEIKDFTNLTGLVDFVIVHQYFDDDPTSTPSDPYSVMVTATDSANNQDSRTVGLTLVNVAPATDDLAISLPDATNTITVTWDFIDPGTLDVHTVEIVWGDGTFPEIFTLPVGQRKIVKTHQLQGSEPPDGYYLVISVQDDDQGKKTETKKVPKVLIWGDVNRDGKITEKDDLGKRSFGIVVIADLEGVYADKEYPARRREIKTTTTVVGAKTVVKRNSGNLLMYDKQSAGNELFGQNDEVVLSPDTSYWLHAGLTPSKEASDHSLKVRLDQANAQFEDEIYVTVLWVKIDGRNSGEFKKNPVYEFEKGLKDLYGDYSLGVRRSIDPSKDVTFAKGELKARGRIEVDGEVLPSDFHRGAPIDYKWARDEKTRDATATVKLGFVFKRKISFKDYDNGNVNKKPYDSAVDRNDDSDAQDITPDFDQKDKKLLIVDNDGPSVQAQQHYPFQHRRCNFVQKIIYSYDNTIPERASKVLNWAFTVDAAYGEDFKLRFIRGAPNKTEDFNSVLVDKHLPSLEVDFAKPALSNAFSLPNNDKKIRRGQTEIVVLDGTDLIGEVLLRKQGQNDILTDLVRVKKNAADPLLGELTQLKASFNTLREASVGWELVIRNSKGESSIGGFEIVD